MRLFKNKKGQSMLEYALLLGVVIAAILIMQVFVKRGFQGGLKDSADKMGEQFSGGNTTISQTRTMSGNQTIEETTAGTAGVGLNTFATGAKDTIAAKAYSESERTGGETATEIKQATDAAKLENFRWKDYDSTKVDNFDAPFTK